MICYLDILVEDPWMASGVINHLCIIPLSPSRRIGSEEIIITLLTLMAADIQKAVAQEEHPLVNTSHNARMKNLQHTHPYTFAALRRTESQKAEMEATVTQRKLAEALNPPTGHTR